jgi:hypothetical protein
MTTEPKVSIEFTMTELNGLAQLLHFAVQARGMEVAEAAVLLGRKLQAAAETLRPLEEANKPGNGFGRRPE